MSTAETRGDDLAARHPVLIIEVVSQQSHQCDLIDKAAEDLALPTLSSYAVFSQDEPLVWLWSRLPDGGWTKSSLTAGLDQQIVLAGLGVTVDLAALYGEFA